MSIHLHPKLLIAFIGCVVLAVCITYPDTTKGMQHLNSSLASLLRLKEAPIRILSSELIAAHLLFVAYATANILTALLLLKANNRNSTKPETHLIVHSVIWLTIAIGWLLSYFLSPRKTEVLGYILLLLLAAIATSHSTEPWRNQLNSARTTKSTKRRTQAFLNQLLAVAGLSLISAAGAWLIRDGSLLQMTIFFLLSLNIGVWSLGEHMSGSVKQSKSFRSGVAFHAGLLFAGAFLLDDLSTAGVSHASAILICLISSLWLIHVWFKLGEKRVTQYSEDEHKHSQRQPLESQDISNTSQAKILAQSKGSQQKQKEFLATMSHELRTPLSCIVGLARLWGQDIEISLGARQDMGTIERMSVQLLRIVDDGLDFVEHDEASIKQETDTVKMRYLIRDLHAIANWLAAQQKNQFILERIHGIPSSLEFDEKRTRQILINILSNAARYCYDGKISLGVKLRSVGSTHFLNWVIRDTGRGMSDEEKVKYFTAFTKSRDSQGLGLGLAIAKRLLEEIGGQIEIRSSKGNGTAVALIIPVKKVRIYQEPEEPGTTPNSDQRFMSPPSIPMDLLPEKAYAGLDFATLRVFIKFGQITEIGEWLIHGETQSLSPPAKQLIEQLRGAYRRVDLELMLSIIDKVDTPLSFS